jgi:hypothetical protein
MPSISAHWAHDIVTRADSVVRESDHADECSELLRSLRELAEWLKPAADANVNIRFRVSSC